MLYMSEKQSFECNTFACKTFASGTFANNQQTSVFIIVRPQAEPATWVTPTLQVIPDDFNKVSLNIWAAGKPAGVSVFLQPQTMSSGSNAFLTARAQAEPATWVAPIFQVIPEDFNDALPNMWASSQSAGADVFLEGQLISSGSNAFLTLRVMSEPDETELNDLILLGRSSATEIVFGMWISGITANIEQPPIYKARLMQKPT